MDARERAQALVDEHDITKMIEHDLDYPSEAVELIAAAIEAAELAVMERMTGELRAALAETEKRVTAAIEAAVAAERERCAVVALEEGHERAKATDEGRESVWGVHRAIARRIREGT